MQGPPLIHIETVKVRLRSLMENSHLDALIAVGYENVYYITGHPSFMLHHAFSAGRALAVLFRNPDYGCALIVSDFEAGGVRSDIKDLEVRAFPIWVHMDDPFGVKDYHGESRQRPGAFTPAAAFDHLGAALKDRGIIGNVGVDSQYATAETWDLLQSKLPDVKTIDATSLFYEARMIKTAWEVDCLRIANEITEKAMLEAASSVAEGVTAADLVARFIQAGRADKRANGLRLASVTVGESFMPQQFPRTLPAKVGDLVKFDVGFEVDGYGADMGRTFVLAKPTDTAARTHAALRQGHDVLYESIRPGRKLSAVFDKAMTAVRDAGLPNYNRGHLGHLIGLEREGEEPPVLGPSAGDTEFAEGMVVAIETPYYGYGVGAIMIEDNVVVTADGVTNFDRSTKDLVEL